MSGNYSFYCYSHSSAARGCVPATACQPAAVPSAVPAQFRGFLALLTWPPQQATRLLLPGPQVQMAMVSSPPDHSASSCSPQPPCPMWMNWLWQVSPPVQPLTGSWAHSPAPAWVALCSPVQGVFAKHTPAERPPWEAALACRESADSLHQAGGPLPRALPARGIRPLGFPLCNTSPIHFLPAARGSSTSLPVHHAGSCLQANIPPRLLHQIKSLLS